jgi:hypothetical protein
MVGLVLPRAPAQPCLATYMGTVGSCTAEDQLPGSLTTPRAEKVVVTVIERTGSAAHEPTLTPRSSDRAIERI